MPIIGARRMARRLALENAAQARELSRLRDIVQRFGIADALARTVALEDLRAEQAVQEARLRDLIETSRHVASAGAQRGGVSGSW
ncbi:MAG: hypothetical protein ABWY58_00595 [Aeromicrobium sp.]